MKKSLYKNMLKQAVSEFDVSKMVDVTGPMLEPILKWRGDGEMPTKKDAASILERFYFHNEDDDMIDTLEKDDEKQTNGEKHSYGDGTEQAGTSDAENVKDRKKEIVDKIMGEIADDENVSENSILENIEKEVIEKLISEMEGEDDKKTEEENDKETDKNEVSESNTMFPLKDFILEMEKMEKDEDEDEDKKDKEENKEEEENKENKENVEEMFGLLKAMRGKDEMDDELYQEALELFRDSIE